MLQLVVADETALKESFQTVHTEAQQELANLEETTVVVCWELDGEGVQSGISAISRLRALGGQVASRLKSALLLEVQKTLGVVSTHYQVSLVEVATG